MTISELAGALREVNLTLERARATTRSAVPLLAESRATLVAVRRDPNGYDPVELDHAMAQLSTAGELIAAARQSILDYLLRL
ncbi:hypothetical protein [Kibdelosporangium phytohabitans]|uniref:Uncharacterized protein n=1 Tax=Kibdelosporangium phytohabitans TaxID=860235 RepID=A0A0N9I867_9PSEU|nr:hypothetical protein [Kibdelosporangium phytohabitans]ALG11116.1 hypothetical protein AOZ06_33325 [Kibdelosporangium phytohabitans]MBE1462364.1 hypothetical protein [Kibdelosporangium phytohabitans]